MEKEYIGDLILLRGIPGSGKSTLGKSILKHLASDEPDVISADDFFVDEKGNYNFDPTRLKEAHEQSLQRCATKMKNEISKIVVANTFTQKWEMDAYYEMAERYNYRVFSVVVENRHGSLNIHGVPEEKVKQMSTRFEISL